MESHNEFVKRLAVMMALMLLNEVRRKLRRARRLFRERGWRSVIAEVILGIGMIAEWQQMMLRCLSERYSDTVEVLDAVDARFLNPTQLAMVWLQDAQTGKDL